MNGAEKNPRGRGGQGFRVIEGGDQNAATRTPPHSVEAEEYLLSSIVLDGSSVLAQCRAAGLKAGAFYVPAHKTVYKKLMEMDRDGLAVELPILAQEMTSDGTLDSVGGITNLAAITSRVPTTAQTPYFIEKVRELWGLRELIKFSTGIVEQCYGFEGDLPAMVNASRSNLERMFDWASETNKPGQVAYAQSAIEAAENAIAGKVDKSRWLTWGIPSFDELFGCFDANNEDWSVILAGLRSQGKSSLARQIAVANLERGKKGVVFNLETGARGWLMRAPALRAGVNLRELNTDPRKDRLKEFRENLVEQEKWMGERLWVFEDVFTVDEVEVRVRDIHRRCGGLDFIVVDYLQLLSLANISRGMNREQQVAEISRRLMLLGKKLNITCFILAQLSRKSADESRRPRISDLRESGQIENDASRVIMLYVLPEGKCGKQDESTVMPECEIIQGKYKNGPTGYERVTFEKPYTRFVPSVSRGDPRPGGRVDPSRGYKRGEE